MQCSEPGAIRDEELLAYLDGVQVRPEVVQHVAHCPRCTAQLGTYQQLERGLTHTLYRWDCPANLTLGEYYLGMVSDEVAAAIQAHVQGCVHCAAELQSLVVFLADDPPVAQSGARALQRSSVRLTPGPLLYPVVQTHQAAQRLFETTLPDPAPHLPHVNALLLPAQPRLAWQRDASGLPEPWPRNYVAQALRVSLQIELAPQQQELFQLLGLATHEGLALEALQGVPVQLLLAEQVLHTQYIDDLGNFVFSALAPAVYSLAVQLPDRIIVVDELPVSIAER